MVRKYLAREPGNPKEPQKERRPREENGRFAEGANPDEGRLNGEAHLVPPIASRASRYAISEALLCISSSSSTASINFPAKRYGPWMGTE